MGDFGFQTGDWRVRHRKLRDRLVGATEWMEFNGTCRAWEVLGGAANVEDQFLDDPAGPYRASALRRRDPETGVWSIWWFDARSPRVDPALQGGFANGVGRFYTEDQLRGKPIKIRFTWSDITPDSAQWEQAFSPDGGATWEVNWTMSFERAAA